MEIVQERLEREFKIEVIQTAPTVPYEVVLSDGTVQDDGLGVGAAGPDHLHGDPGADDQGEHHRRRRRTSGTSCSFASTAAACTRRRSIITTDRIILEYEMPLSEVIYDFFDKLKTATQGYGTLDYELIGFHEDDLVKMDILVAGDKMSSVVFDRP